MSGGFIYSMDDDGPELIGEVRGDITISSADWPMDEWCSLALLEPFSASATFQLSASPFFEKVFAAKLARKAKVRSMRRDIVRKRALGGTRRSR